MKKFSLVLMLFAINSCAPTTPTAPCTPNFSGNGMNVRMVFLRDNSDGTQAYSVQLCGDSKPSPIVYSVYGTPVTETTVTDPNSAVRLRQVESSSQSGAQFEVNFRSTDYWFAIFQDAPTSGGYTLDTHNELVNGKLNEAQYAGGGT